MLAHLFLQLQGAGLIEKQVVVSSDAEEQASGSGQGAVGQLPPGTWQLPLCMDTLPRGRLPHAQRACVGTRAAGLTGPQASITPAARPGLAPPTLVASCQEVQARRLHTQLRRRLLWQQNCSLHTLRTSRSEVAAPHPTPPHSMALAPHLKHRHGPCGLEALQVPNNADLVTA